MENVMSVVRPIAVFVWLIWMCISSKKRHKKQEERAERNTVALETMAKVFTDLSVSDIMEEKEEEEKCAK